jgi:hypothetical protein
VLVNEKIDKIFASNNLEDVLQVTEELQSQIQSLADKNLAIITAQTQKAITQPEAHPVVRSKISLPSMKLNTPKESNSYTEPHPPVHEKTTTPTHEKTISHEKTSPSHEKKHSTVTPHKTHHENTTTESTQGEKHTKHPVTPAKPKVSPPPKHNTEPAKKSAPPEPPTLPNLE